MEKFRLHQTQSLLRKAGKSKVKKEKLKPPKRGKINVDIFVEALNNTIDAEEFIYTSRPSHKLNDEEAKIFCLNLLNIRDKIDVLLAEFGVIEVKDVENEIKKLSKDSLILTSKSSFKKSMTKFGVDPRQIIVTGVPLDLEDMKVINPDIPESALEPIKKKIKHVKNDINRKLNSLNLNKILVIVENDVTGEVLCARAKELYDAQAIRFDVLRDISPDEFMRLISKSMTV